MAGTRNAPDVTLAATYKSVSFHWVDSSNDKWSESYLIPVAATQAQIEAVADALQVESGASLYWIEVHNGWGTSRAASPANASEVDNKSDSVYDSVNITLVNTNPLIKNQIVRVPAPIKLMFVAGDGDTTSDNVDGTQVALDTLQAAIEAMLGAGYQAIYARYSEKNEINEATPLTTLA